MLGPRGLDQQLRGGRAGQALDRVGIHVVPVRLQELEHLRFGHSGPLYRVFIVVADRHGPGDLPGLHGADHMVEGRIYSPVLGCPVGSGREEVAAPVMLAQRRASAISTTWAVRVGS